MIQYHQNNIYIFVIDTNKYAGNFERQLCAYCTGVYADCHKGIEEAAIYDEEVGNESLFNNILMIPDDSDGNILRPCSIYKTPGWFNNGMGGHFRLLEEEEALKARNKVYIEYVEKHPTSNLDVNEPLFKFPAYMSVAINFSKLPTQEQINVIQERAKKYCKNNDIEISKFRCIKIVTKLSTILEEKA